MIKFLIFNNIYFSMSPNLYVITFTCYKKKFKIIRKKKYYK